MIDFLLQYIATTLEGFDEMINGAVEVLMDSAAGGSANWASMLSLSEYLKPFCLIVVGICVLIELANTAAKVDMITWEQGVRLGIKVCLAKVFIDIAPVFLRACYVQAQSWIAAIGSGWGSSQFGFEMLKNLDGLRGHLDSSFWGGMGLFFTTFAVVIAIGIAGVIIKATAYGRIFELYVYLIASPLPCAFFPLGDGSGGGFSQTTSKFLRSFAAVCLQGVLMIVVIKIFDVVLGNAIMALEWNYDPNTITPEIASAALTNVTYTMLMGSIAMVMAIGKCGSWAKSILDAGG